MAKRAPAVLLGIALLVSSSVVAQAPKQPIDVQRSTLKVFVYKSGIFSAFGHNHIVAAPIEEGWVSLGPAGVEFRVVACKLRVLDPDVDADERAKVQATMEGPEVLDCTKFPEIRFQSNAVEPAGTDQWTVRGLLSLHGQARPVTVAVKKQGARYVGSASLKQRDFGMTPVSVAGGTVRVKDEVKIEFEIHLKE
ncbi:MAG TPA: YceI family protein [Candidatus Xenobia bacterium]|nr:YceI family protein [Candidatus Xenobia bacterium]